MRRVLARADCPKCGKSLPTGGGYIRHVRCCGRQEEFFWAKVERLPWSGCWIWMGYVQRFGHGWLGQYGLAHRYAWKLMSRELRDDQFLLHLCDIPACVNPDHLYIGTRADNNRDKVLRGRILRGEASPRSKITEEAVRDIRLRYTHEIAPALAAEYGISASHVYAIAARRSWSHLN